MSGRGRNKWGELPGPSDVRPQSGLVSAIDLGGGYAVSFLKRVVARAEESGLDFDVTLELDQEEGRLVCVSFTATRVPGGPPVTAVALNQLPVVRLMERALDHTLATLTRDPWGNPERVDVAKLEPLERAALEYRIAYAFGRPPTKAVAAALGVTDAVAAKRVQAARRAGLLDPTTKGRKGS